MYDILLSHLPDSSVEFAHNFVGYQEDADGVNIRFEVCDFSVMFGTLCVPQGHVMLQNCQVFGGI